MRRNRLVLPVKQNDLGVGLRQALLPSGMREEQRDLGIRRHELEAVLWKLGIERQVNRSAFEKREQADH